MFLLRFQAEFVIFQKSRRVLPYLTCTLAFPPPFQNPMENAMLEQYKKMLLAFYQQVWCWTDEWYGLTMEDIRFVLPRCTSFPL